MAFISPRAPRTSRRASRLVTTLALVLGLVWSMAACGFDVQTNQPYTPGDGINADVGPVKVRNLMILTRRPGEGFLSGSLVSAEQDALTGITGVTVKADGTKGAALTVKLSDPVSVGNNLLVVLTNRAAISVTDADLQAGLTAELVLSFSDAGTLNVTVPVLDASQGTYATVSPTPAPSPSS